MDGKKYLRDACVKYNLNFNTLFYFGVGKKGLTEYKSGSGYKKPTITQSIPGNYDGKPQYVIKFMKIEQIYIVWRWKGHMTYSIFVKDVQAQEGKISKVPHYESIIGGKQENILVFKPDAMEQFIGHYVIGGMQLSQN